MLTSRNKDVAACQYVEYPAQQTSVLPSLVVVVVGPGQFFCNLVCSFWDSGGQHTTAGTPVSLDNSRLAQQQKTKPYKVQGGNNNTVIVQGTVFRVLTTRNKTWQLVNT